MKFNPYPAVLFVKPFVSFLHLTFSFLLFASAWKLLPPESDKEQNWNTKKLKQVDIFIIIQYPPKFKYQNNEITSSISLLSFFGAFNGFFLPPMWRKSDYIKKIAPLISTTYQINTKLQPLCKWNKSCVNFGNNFGCKQATLQSGHA